MTAIHFIAFEGIVYCVYFTEVPAYCVFIIDIMLLLDNMYVQCVDLWHSG